MATCFEFSLCFLCLCQFPLEADNFNSAYVTVNTGASSTAELIMV